MFTLSNLVQSFVHGILFTIFIQIVLLYYWVYKPFKSLSDVNALNGSSKQSDGHSNGVERDEDVNNKDFKREQEEWPPGIRQYLQSVLNYENNNNSMSTQSNESNVDWINAIVHRYFLICRSSEVFRIKICQKLLTRLNAKLRGPNSIVQEISIADYSLGSECPIVHSVRLVKQSSIFKSSSLTNAKDLDVIIEADVEYAGGCRLKIVASLNLGIKVPVSIQLNGFRGRLQIRVPAPYRKFCYAIAFTQDPGFDFSVETSVVRRDYEFVMKDVLTKFLSRKLKQMMLQSFVLPHWRAFELPVVNYRPIIIPELEALLGFSNLNLLSQVQNDVQQMMKSGRQNSPSSDQDSKDLMVASTIDDDQEGFQQLQQQQSLKSDSVVSVTPDQNGNVDTGSVNNNTSGGLSNVRNRRLPTLGSLSLNLYRQQQQSQKSNQNVQEIEGEDKDNSNVQSGSVRSSSFILGRKNVVGDSKLNFGNNRRRSSLNNDILIDRCFPVTSVIAQQNYDRYAEQLVDQFVQLCLENNPYFTANVQVADDADQSYADDQNHQHINNWLSQYWSTQRNKRDVLMQRKSVQIPLGTTGANSLIQSQQTQQTASSAPSVWKSEAYRSSFILKQQNVDLCFKVVENIEHLRHVEDSFVESKIIQMFSSKNQEDNSNAQSQVNTAGNVSVNSHSLPRSSQRFNCRLVALKFKIGRGGEDISQFYTMCVTKRVSINGITGYVVVYRSCSPTSFVNAGISNDRLITSDSTVSSDPMKANEHSGLLHRTQSMPTPGQQLQRQLDSQAIVKQNSDIDSVQNSQTPSTSNKQMLDDESQLPVMNIFGYLVLPIHGDNNRADAVNQSVGGGGCLVINLSSFGSTRLSKLEVNWPRSFKLKSFIEELAGWTQLTSPRSPTMSSSSDLPSATFANSQLDSAGSRRITDQRGGGGQRFPNRSKSEMMNRQNDQSRGEMLDDGQGEDSNQKQSSLQSLSSSSITTTSDKWKQQLVGYSQSIKQYVKSKNSSKRQPVSPQSSSSSSATTGHVSSQSANIIPLISGNMRSKESVQEEDTEQSRVLERKHSSGQ
ncbi:hypothetical protein MP228_011639 [Amoeboaphelidium protococcarum]|nr:hypothetical protein MP228_011639 [Amoeboaphelidium protococcarum]